MRLRGRHFFKRKWIAEEADGWTKEDWAAIVLSCLAYINITVGLALALLLIPIGFFILAIGIAAAFYMYWIIDPKLRAISEDYEHKQKEYLKRLEEIEEWKT